ncbi:MAG TPA: serine hydrolase family protein [Arcobacter sp.]|jgi:predicted alpha/beta hydrolase family esterase|nr:serine hydrolase family protein [Arcobacter sp.]
MKKVLILSGWGGSDYPHWQSHLAVELIKENYTVSFPDLPNRDNPNLDEWLAYLDNEMKHFKPDIVVCHSLANILWFHYTSNYKVQELEKLMLVSPVSPLCEIEELKTFFPYPIPQDLRAREKIMAAGDNDPYITLDELYYLSNLLQIGLKVMENGGHLNVESGYGKLDCAFDWIVDCKEKN